MVSLPRCLSEALYSLQLRMRYVAFFFIARKAYHVTASATLHSDSCNKANRIQKTNDELLILARKPLDALKAQLKLWHRAWLAAFARRSGLYAEQVGWPDFERLGQLRL